MILPRILVLDDEASIRNNFIRYLEDYEEFALLQAGSGEEALMILEEHAAAVCVVDMRLPGINGMEFITMASRRKLCSRFLIHTGSLDMIVGNDFQELHINDADIFFKPCDIESILQRIRHHVATLTNTDTRL